MAVGTVIGAAMLAACGGSRSTGITDGTTVSPSPAITRSQLIKRSDRICREIDAIQNKKLESYIAAHQKAPADLATQETEVRIAGLPPIAVEIDKIKALGAPKGDEAEMKALIESLERALSKVEDDPSLAIGKTHSPFDAPDKLAKKYGFKDCAEAL